MRYVYSVLFVVMLFLGAFNAFAQNVDDAKWKQLEIERDAKLSYLKGEDAFKAGDFYLAIKSWKQTLEIKPNSEYTKKRLNEAINKVLKSYEDFSKLHTVFNDPVSNVVFLNNILKELPERTDIADKLAQIKSKMTPQQKTALDALNKFYELYSKDPTAAEASLKEAQENAKDSYYVIECVKTVENYKQQQLTAGNPQVTPPPSEPKAEPKQEPKKETPKAEPPKPKYKWIMMGRDACGWCKLMKPELYKAQPLYTKQIKFEFLNIDSNANRPLMVKYGMSGGLPFNIFVDPEGNKIFGFNGYKPLEDVKAMLANRGFMPDK